MSTTDMGKYKVEKIILNIVQYIYDSNHNCIPDEKLCLLDYYVGIARSRLWPKHIS
jgi:hypothetical protein